MENIVETIRINEQEIHNILNTGIFKLRDEVTIEVSLPKQKSLNALFSALDDLGVRVLSMRNKANRLEELFLRLVDKGTLP